MPHGIKIRGRSAPARCALCHDDLLGPGTTCPRCGTVAHLECRAELARCPTLACSLPSWWESRSAGTRSTPRVVWPRLTDVAIVALLLAILLVGAVSSFREALNNTFCRCSVRINDDITPHIK